MTLNKYALDRDPDYINYRLGSPERFNPLNPRARNKPYTKRKLRDKRPVWKSKRQFTLTEDRIIIAMTNQGHGPEEIGASLGRRVVSVEKRIQFLRDTGEPLRKD